MIRILRALTLAMICCAVAYSQIPNPQCPTVSVTGPGNLTRPGSVMTFTANVPNDYHGSYKWSVSEGVIERYRDKPLIYVRVPSDTNTPSITVTVELNGLSAGCPGTASETGYVDTGGDPMVVDTYGRLSASDEKARLANVSNELAKNPNMAAFIVLRVPKRAKRAAYNARVKTITTLFRSLRVGKNKYLFVDAGNGELSTTIYLMPPDSVPDSWKAGKYQ
jgi:hypothetical protein